jgi:hypothetical protein
MSQAKLANAAASSVASVNRAAEPSFIDSLPKDVFGLIFTALSLSDMQALRLSARRARDYLNEAMFQFLWSCGCSTLYTKFDDPPLLVASLMPVLFEPTYFNLCKNVLAPSAALRAPVIVKVGFARFIAEPLVTGLVMTPQLSVDQALREHIEWRCDSFVQAWTVPGAGIPVTAFEGLRLVKKHQLLHKWVVQVG